MTSTSRHDRRQVSKDPLHPRSCSLSFPADDCQLDTGRITGCCVRCRSEIRTWRGRSVLLPLASRIRTVHLGNADDGYESGCSLAFCGDTLGYRRRHRCASHLPFVCKRSIGCNALRTRSFLLVGLAYCLAPVSQLRWLIAPLTVKEEGTTLS